VSPANILAQEEVFGPVLAAMSFRTIDEGIALANNTRYGLAASVWSENVNLALHVAPQLKAGVVWINGTNMFDAACGFGGYRESGFGREGGREGMPEYLVLKEKTSAPYRAIPMPDEIATPAGATSIDRTPKLFIGGKQVRPDGNYAFAVAGAKGRLAGEAGLGNRKDIRDAVSAARASKWGAATAYNRCQVLYYFAENLAARADEFAARLASLTGASARAARMEVDLSVERLFASGSLADKFEGRVHAPPMRAVTLALNEPVGVIGIVAPDQAPLLALISMMGPALAMGNAVVAVPSSRYPLVATDLYQVMETSDLPPGAVNIVTGRTQELARVLAQHDDVDGLWCVADAEICKMVEYESAGNLKRTWTTAGKAVDWTKAEPFETVLPRLAVEVKNVWVPYGD
jgi:aldehyde dehydrogenase (NAD+)